MRRYRHVIACALALILILCGAPKLLAATASAKAHSLSPEESAASTLETFAQSRFAPLSAAERKLVRAAPMRALPWLGPSDDTDNPLNDAAHGDKWGPERTVRAELIRWLVAEPEASRLVHPSGLAMAGARISGKLDLSYVAFDKMITLVRCYVPDGIDLSSAHLEEFDVRRSNTGAITGDNSVIERDATFVSGDYGPVSFFRAHVDGNLDFTGSRIMSPGDNSVNLVESMVGGDVTFHDGFVTDGTVDARLAKIGYALDFHNIEFQGEGGVNAERASIAGTFYWTDIKHTPTTTLDLENAHAGAIWDDEASWPAPGKLVINGFIYGEIAGGPDNAPSRLRWLALQPPGYSPQPYRELAKALNENGREEGATEVRIAKEIAQRRFGRMSRMQRAWSLMLQITIGFGYRPLRALWWIGGFVGLGTLLFGWGYAMRIITPTEETAYEHFVERGEAPTYYPVFNPFIYSLENFLPVVELHQDKYWRPNARHAARGKVRLRGEPLDASALPSRMLRAYLWIHILAGWTITPLLFAGLSGLVRPD
jgi:hypothetical protein